MSDFVSKVLRFPQSTLQNLPHSSNEAGSFQDLPLLCGILSEANYSWLAKGPCLEVRNNKTGCKVGAWTFGYILKDSNTRVICVDEIKKPYGKVPLLAVALECPISGGLICIFDIYGSKIIRTILVKQKITSLHVVDSGFNDLNLPGPLRNFDGILAVGTEFGNVLLVDICRQICEEALQKINSCVVRDELYPCQLVILDRKDISRIEYHKEASLRDGDHLAFHLNVVTDSRTQHFTLKGQKGEDRIHVNKDEVTTSALYYCPQLASLLVGYNFGAYQLWDLSNLKLIYTSPVCEEHMPITHFTVQEPDDDPRAFCYIWAVYSSTELYQSTVPFAVMYSLCYETKDYQEGYGYLYQDFQSCAVRFQVELVSVQEAKIGLKGGCCIGLQSIHQKSASHRDRTLDSSEGSLSLCSVTWSVWLSNKEVQTNMLLFDLNQWYKEQMPKVPKLSDTSNYMLKKNLTHILATSVHKGGNILATKIDTKSIQQFLGSQRLEEHFCPNSLSYDVWCLRENDIAQICNHGLQKSLLTQIEGAGPLCLIKPADVFQKVLLLGLTPLFSDMPHNAPVSTDIQRETVLNVGLEQELIGWLCKCASEWANGSFSAAGCSLDLLINWAFDRAVLLKTNCDNYCTPLFDYSQTRLDQNTCALINNCTRQIKSVVTFYTHLLTKLSEYLSNPELVMDQFKVLQVVSVYYEVLQWLVNVGLLPECPQSAYPRSDERERISAPYPVQQLTEYYSEKRTMLQQISQGSFASSDSLLFIDNLISHKCGAESLQKYWQDDGGSGLYPPPSLQSLLRTYLVEGPDINHKHSLVIYVFLDLAMALEQERYDPVITHLIKFPAVFKVSPSIIKITQAFWQLDHGDYTTAMEQLLDPFVLSDDLENWHHAVALRALLLQNQHNYALLYMQVRKPSIVDEKDVLTAISLFIANNMLDEAFYFQKHYQNNNQEKLLSHLFNECNKNESIRTILYKCLDSNEEKAFFNYLQTIRDPSTDDLQVFYYLLRSRFVEAFDTHQQSKRMRPECQGLIGQRSATRTDNIVRFFKNLLPEVNKNLVDVIRKERNNLWMKVDRPTPLSVFVHNGQEQVQYKSTVIHAALAKAKQTFIDSNIDNTTGFKNITTEETPFLRTPIAFINGRKRQTQIITPKVIDLDESDEVGPSPCKRLCLSARSAASSPLRNVSSIQSKMSTPIVKRKLSDAQRLSNNRLSVSTPQSILKVKHLNETEINNTFTDELTNEDEARHLNKSPKKSAFGLTPRKSLPRTPIVRFDDARYSSISDPSPSKLSFDNTSLKLKNSLTLGRPSVSNEVSHSSNDTSSELYYSPDDSMNDLEKSVETEKVEEQPGQIKESEKLEIKNDLPPSSLPRSRRSYKRSLAESSPIRSSPRSLASNQSSFESSQSEKSTPTTSKKINEPALLKLSESPIRRESPRVRERISARKSLSRQVLENNASKLLPSYDTSNSITVEKSFTKTETSIVTKSSLCVETHETIVNSPTAHSSKSYSENLCSSTSNSNLNDTSYVYNGPTLSKSLIEYINMVKEEADKITNVEVVKKKLEEENQSEKINEKNSTTTANTDEIVLVENDNPEEAMEVDNKFIYENLETQEETEDIYATEESVYADLSYSAVTVTQDEKEEFCLQETNILEANIIGEEDISNSVSLPSELGSIVSDVDDFEKGFIADETNRTRPEVIEINTSSDSNNSSNGSSSDYGEGELQIAYERNINTNVDDDCVEVINEENSRSSEKTVILTEEEKYSRKPIQEVIDLEEVNEEISNGETEVVVNEPEEEEEKVVEEVQKTEQAKNTTAMTETKSTVLESDQNAEGNVETSTNTTNFTDLNVKQNEKVQESEIDTTTNSVESIGRRVTRRSSQLLSSTNDSEEPTSSNQEQEDANVVVPTIGKRRGRSQSVTSNSSETEKIVTDKKSPKRVLRTRSASMDQVPAPVVQKRSLRSTSVDQITVEKEKPRSTRASSQLPVISETGDGGNISESYTASRRLTRRQSLLMKAAVEGSKIQEMDTLESQNQGETVPEEGKVYETSPSNSASSRKTPARRLNRSASANSENSTPILSTPPRRTRKSQSHVDTPMTTGIKARLRRTSTESLSAISDKSEDPSPPKRGKKDTASEDGTVRSTRSRTSSISSVKSDIDGSDSPRRSTRARKTVSVKSDLPEISEEKSAEEVEAAEKSILKKRGRKPSSSKS